MNIVEAIQALQAGKKIRRPCWVSHNYIYFNGKCIFWEGGQVFNSSLTSLINDSDWELYQPTVKFKDVPLGHMFKYPRPESRYGIKVQMINVPNVVVYNVLDLDENKKLEGRPEALKEDDSEVIYPA